MKQIMLCIKMLGFFSVFLLSGSYAVAKTSAYWVGSDGEIVRDGFGGCVRTIDWKPSLANPSCEGGKAEEKPQAKISDADGDGVTDSQDNCPGTPAGVTVDAKGCALDSDGDSVVDYKDRCPGTAPGTRVDVYGCELKSVTSLKGVNFKTNSSQLTSSSSEVLDDVAATLKKNPDVGAEVAGHTDSSGARAYNVSLSKRRAEAVRQYLINKGIDSGRLTAKGYGPDYPIADNSSRDGRAKNRRVELRIKK